MVKRKMFLVKPLSIIQINTPASQISLLFSKQMPIIIKEAT